MSDDVEVFVSVDVETSGPIPGEYSMLTIGACMVSDPDVTFSCGIKPIGDGADPDALAVMGLTLDGMAEAGLEPRAAMAAFARWLTEAVGAGGVPVFVDFNAPFDWSFVNYYFYRYLGRNPFGFTALDIKAMYLGRTGCDWRNTRSSRMAERLDPRLRGDHDALHDAHYQAELFRLVSALPTA